MDFFKNGKFEHCLEIINKTQETGTSSVSLELLMQNDVLVCQYMLGQRNGQGACEDFKQLLMKAASLPPTEESSRLGLTLLHNFIYCDLLSASSQCLNPEFTELYTQSARVLFRVNTALQPLSSSELRKDLPTDPKACCDFLVYKCIDGISFCSDAHLLVPFCYFICLLAVIELRRDNWKPAIQLLSSVTTAVKMSHGDTLPQPDQGFMLPLSIDESTENVTFCPLDCLNFLLGLAHFQDKQWKQSREILQRVKQDWYLPYASYLTGLGLLKEGEFTEAVTVVGQSIKTTKIIPLRLKAKMFNLLGDCFGKLEKPQLSIQMYKEALSVDFGYLLPLYNISLQYQQLGTRDVELECLNLLVTSLESDVSLAVPAEQEKRFIFMLDHVTTYDNNMSFPVAVYRQASRCLQLERFDVASQKYQELLAFLTDCRSSSQLCHLADLPSLRQIHHEAILSLLKVSKYSECLILCDKVIACYHKGQGHYLSTDVFIDQSQLSDVVNSGNKNDSQNKAQDDLINNNDRLSGSGTVDNCTNDIVMNIDKQTLKRKRQDSDSSTSITVTKTSENEGKSRTLSCGYGSGICDGQSSEFDQLDCDVLALKYKAEVLEKLGEVDAAVECLESAIKSISSHRKTTFQRNMAKITDNLYEPDQPVSKRQRVNSHGDTNQRSGWDDTASDYDMLTRFESELYQSFGAIMSSQGQYSDALHYYRLASQLQPDRTEIHYLCTKTLLSMKCPKIACSNWLKHRKLPQTTSFQVSSEIARKQQISRSGLESEEKDYSEMDVKCLTLQQGYLLEKE